LEESLVALNIDSHTDNGIARITLAGELDASSAPAFRTAVEEAASTRPRRLALLLDKLEYMSSAGLRILVFAKQKLGAATEIVVVGAQPSILETLEMTGFQDSVVILDAYDAARIDA
jgi:anti-anti-sigma factor